MNKTEPYTISSLDIENFRQYRKAYVEFSQDPEKIFTIIRGANGAGKTNIMNAITWCLYGKEKHHDSNENDLPIINTKALKEKPNGLVNMKVSLRLADSDGEKFMIERKMVLYNNGNVDDTTYDKDTNMIIPEMSTPTITKNFQLYDSDEGGWQRTDYFDKKVKELLPEDLAIYFLFDGENLEDFFVQVDDTKKGIEDVSQVKITEQAIDTLTKLVSNQRKSFKSLDPKVNECKEKLSESEKALVDYKKAITNLQSKLRDKEQKYENLEQDIINAGGDTSKYQQQAKDVKNTIEILQKRYNGLKSEMKDYVLEHMSGMLMLESVKGSLNKIKMKGDEGMFPPKMQETFIEELLEKNKCICGNDISMGHSSREMVEKHLKSAKYSSIGNICTEIKFALKPILKVEDVLNDLDQLDTKLAECEKQLNDKIDHLEELETKIGSTDEESIKRKSDDKLSLKSEIAKLNQDLGIKQNDKDMYTKNCEIYSRELDSERHKVRKHDTLDREINFCQNSLNSLQKMRDELLDDVRNTVQNYTKEYFLKFLWKKNTYVDVTIDKDYRITAKHEHGYDVRAGLSKGEKLVLALSFMAALRKITGFGFPLLIDTPLGRVSGEPRHNIAKSLPTFLKDNQVTLLVTDAEYQAQIQDDENKQQFPPIRDTIGLHVGADYDIIFTDGESKVKSR